MSLEIKEKIISKGYWRVQIRPSISDYKKERIKFTELADKIENSQVRLRGWDYPHFRAEDKKIISDTKIYHEDNFEGHIESLEFTTSGQFVHLSSMPEDYKVTPEQLEKVKSSFVFSKDKAKDVTKLLEVVSTVYRFTEIFLFASQLAQNKEFEDVNKFDIKIELVGVKGRMLYIWEFMRELFSPYICWFDDDKLIININISKDILIAEYDRLARESLIQIFQKFGWEDVSESMISGDQAKLLERRI